MKINDFYDALNKLPQQYNFDVQSDKSILGVGKRKLQGATFNPVTAVAHRATGDKFGTNKRETQRAGKALGLSRNAVDTVYNATTSGSNRGNTQVVRGKIRSALEI
jgi:hypothetical protein